jgi:hypothetical protein
VVARTTDLKGVDVAGECDGSPGSGGASPSLRRDSLRQPVNYLRARAFGVDGRQTHTSEDKLSNAQFHPMMWQRDE